MTLPRYSAAQLDAKALAVIGHYRPASAADQEAVPVELFIEALQNSGHLEYSELALGYIGMSKILGLFTARPRPAIYIDQSIVGTVRYRFTLAHELGHFVLHRKLEVGGSIRDTSEDLLETPASAQTERQWAEWQANNFASSILLPAQSLGTFVFDNVSRFGLSLGEGMVTVPPTASGSASLDRFIEYAASCFDVSKTTLRLRLMRLGII